jgi:dTDP-glucose 4,6-dehydratase
MQSKKRILVTGSKSFIGHNFLNLLDSQEDVEFILAIDKISSISVKSEPYLHKDYFFVKGHTKNTQLIESLLIDYKITDCVNFAASSHVDESIRNPDLFLEDNIIGTYGLIKACLNYQKINKNFKVIHISTDEVYGSLDFNQEPFTEKSCYQPSSPYSSTKASSDHLVNSFNKTFGLNAIITHSCNNFGKFQNTEKFIPKIISNTLKSIPVPLYGNGLNVREWIHVDDNNSAIYFLMNKGEIGESYNIGSGEEYNNIEIIKIIFQKILAAFNVTGEIEFVKDRLAHDLRYALNSSKLRRLGWSPKINLIGAIDEIIKWYAEIV